jgi:hypothetical protein
MDILELMDSERFLGRWFRGPTWDAWRVCLAVAFRLTDRIDERGMAMYTAATARTELPGSAIRQVFLCIGRRGGKSIIAALVAVFAAFFCDYTPYLAAGEVATIMTVAADHKQARVVLRFIRGFIRHVPSFAKKVVRETRESIELSNRVTIEVHTASYRSTRGYTLAAVINDELAFWLTDDSAEPDKAIIEARLPAMATIPNALMLNISSPGGRRGYFWSAYEQHWGKGTPGVLYWKAPSRSLDGHEGVEMNPGLDLKTVQDAYAADSAVAASDYGAEFRSDLERLFTDEMLDACTDWDRPLILPPNFDEEEVAQ